MPRTSLKIFIKLCITIVYKLGIKLCITSTMHAQASMQRGSVATVGGGGGAGQCPGQGSSTTRKELQPVGSALLAPLPPAGNILNGKNKIGRLSLIFSQSS